MTIINPSSFNKIIDYLNNVLQLGRIEFKNELYKIFINIFIWRIWKKYCNIVNHNEIANSIHIINSPKTVDSIREVKLDDELIKK